MRAMPDHVIVRREEVIKSMGLIILPDKQNYKNRKCKVLDVGPLKIKNGFIPNDEIKVGDYLAVIGYDGIQLKPLEDPGLLSVNVDVVLGVIDKNAQFTA